MGYFALQNKEMQSKVVHVVSESLSKQVGSEVDIDELEWTFPNSFILNNVYIEDLKGDTMLFLERTKVTINLIQLFSSKVSFRTIQFTGLDANLSVDSLGVSNFQFFIDAFRREKDDSLSIKWSMDIESMAFNDCAFTFSNPYKEKKIGRFDPNNLSVSEINGRVYVRSFEKDSIYILLEELSMKEQSDFAIDNISATVSGNNEYLGIDELLFKTPNSEINIANVQLYHDNYKSFKDPLEKLRTEIEILPSNISVSDFSAFRPSLSALDGNLYIKGKGYGKSDKFQLKDFELSYGESTIASGDFYVNNLYPDPNNIRLDAIVNNLSTSFVELSEVLSASLNKQIKFPTFLDSIGVVTYQGELEGTIQNMFSDGIVQTNAGILDVMVKLQSNNLNFEKYKIEGNIGTSSINLGKLLGAKTELGKTAFQLDVLFNRSKGKSFTLDAQGNIDTLEFRNYQYKNISLNGKFDTDGFDGKLIVSDKNAELSFEGRVDTKKDKPISHFFANVSNLNLSETNLLKNIPDAKIAFDVETNVVGHNIDEFEGAFSIDNVIFTQEDKEISFNNFSISAEEKENNSKVLNIYSDYVNGYVKGIYTFSDIAKKLYNIGQYHLSSILKAPKEIKENSANRGNDFSFKLSIENLEPINEVYPLPFVVLEESELSGFFNDKKNQVKVRLESPSLQLGKNTFKDCMVLLENPKDEIKAIARATFTPRNKRRYPYFVALNSKLKHDTLDLKVNFSNSDTITYSGELSTKAIFKDYIKGEGLTADIYVNPSNVILNDTIWEMHKSKIQIDKKRIDVDSFYFNHNSQFLVIDGVNSSSEKDSINIHFSDLQLGYISDMVNNKNISFDGVSDGDLYLFNLFNTPFFKGELYVYDAELNDYVLGDMSVNTNWDKIEKSVLFNAKLLSLYDEQLSRSDIFGGVYLGNDSLYIEGDIKNVDLRFLRTYLKSVLQNNTGTVSGNVKAFGKFGHIGLMGTAYVKDFAFDVEYLNTSYVLSDSVYLTPTTIQLNQTQAFDIDGNSAIVSGLILHDGFKNFKFAVDLDCLNFLALNTKEEDNETFYGKAYANGNAKISGVPELVNIEMNVRTMPNTIITIPLEGTSTANEGSFITFVKKEENQTASEKRRLRHEKLKQFKERNSSKTTMNLLINLEATPDAQVHLIMDAQQGDLIRANGYGNLQMLYNTKDDDFRMYGNYEISKGDYLFTIQSIISRKFDINSGSTVRWTGNPYNAYIDIQAKYGLNASLTDIIEDPNLRSTATNVNCLLNLSGTINSPTIKFDIDLPNSDDDTKSKLKSVINTEEEMNKNIASLLALGHFYNTEGSITTTATNELSSVGFSTLSSQLSNWLSRMSQDINIGLNYRPSSISEDGTTTSSEFDVALSTQLLNDRLLLNGNFGYRDEVANTSNISNSIIDFDLEYKLSKSGKLRTKGFNRSNNSYFKQAANTQGIGLIYREDFDTFSGLMKSYWKGLTKIFRKEDDEEDVEEDKKKMKEKDD